MSTPKFSLRDFLSLYPDDEACLAEILERKYPNFVCRCGRTRLYKVANRPVYACACGFQIRPLAGTVMSNTKIPLSSWFYAIYLMTQSKNGLAAAELQRHLGVSYQTAWRVCFKIREAMKEEGLFGGEVEVDETYIRAKPWRTTRPLAYNGQAQTVVGVVERGGRARAMVIPTNSRYFLNKTVKENVLKGSKLYTDGWDAYKSLNGEYIHQYVIHSQGEWVRDDVHTQNVENLWHGIKLGLQGTHKGVSPEYLENYLNFWTWIWSQKNSSEPLFFEALKRL